MKAIGYKNAGPIGRDDAFLEIELDTPTATGRDILVKVHAVSVNPVDTKLRANRPPLEDEYQVLGFDASGVVEAIGPDVKNFKAGDAVYYAGSVNRQGTNSEFHLVDERIVGNKPTTLNHAEAAALPLTTITAWEMLFDRLNVNDPPPQGGDVILVIGGAGGVGSIAIQLLRALTDKTIIATASRPQTQDWVREIGAHHVIDHTAPLAPQVEALGLGAPGFVFSTTQSDTHFVDIVEMIVPQGRFGLIDTLQNADIMALKPKSISLHWEFMFTRSQFQTVDIAEQGVLLNLVAELVDGGKVKTTLTEIAGKIDVATLRKVHEKIESGKSRGKIVLEGF